MNKVMLLGRLGKDPELKYTTSGKAVCEFSLATSESWNDRTSGKKNESTEWHTIIVWDGLAELCQKYLAKGRQALIEGKIKTRSWTDKEGNTRYKTEIVATNVTFIGGNASNNNQTKEKEQVTSQAEYASEDIPF